MAAAGNTSPYLYPPKLGTCSSTPLSLPIKPSPNCVSPTLLKTLSDIQTSGVIACLRAPSAELALGAARAALSSGIKALEVVMSTPGVFEVLHQLVEEYPTTTLGVGTILKPEDADHAMKAGAKFLMSPAMIPEIIADLKGQEVLYIPGVMTPTEILSAHNAGAKMVKIYPVSALGGVSYIAAIKKPFPHIPMAVSQGITLGLVKEYITRGASSVVLSDAIFDKDAVAKGHFGTISQRAKTALSMASQAKERLKPLQVNSSSD